MQTADLLRKLISIQSFSGEEKDRAAFLAEYLNSKGISVKQLGNNLMAEIKCAGDNDPMVMLNSHIDTVKPASGYTFEPFNPPFDSGIVRGLGSNDAGGSVVSMVETALYFHKYGGVDFNILLLLSAEEENSGPNGMRMAINEIKNVACAIIGEPTGMKAAVAERGLLVLDGVATGISGHAARNEGVNAIYIALEDIELIKKYRFSNVSSLMGEVKISVTQVNAGTQHNVIPDRCSFVVDIRPTDCYNNEEIYRELQEQVKSTLTPRSLSNRSSATPVGHTLLKCAEQLEIERYVSPTTSDWMRIGDIPAIKMGPGESARSHMADEYILVEELESGVKGYIEFLKNLKM